MEAEINICEKIPVIFKRKQERRTHLKYIILPNSLPI